MAKMNYELPNSITMASKEYRTSNCENESRSKFTPNVDVIGDDQSLNIDLPRLGVMEFPKASLPTLHISTIHDQLFNP
jgi:hypothetical protein